MLFKLHTFDNLNRLVHAKNTIILELLQKAEGLSVEHKEQLKVLIQGYMDIMSLNDGRLGTNHFTSTLNPHLRAYAN